MAKVLIPGEIIVADIIGEGFYEIVDFSEYHVNVRCLKLFGKGWESRGHITNCHRMPDPVDLQKWLSYKRIGVVFKGYVNIMIKFRLEGCDMADAKTSKIVDELFENFKS